MEQTYLTPDRILGHPTFPAARDMYIDAVLELYEAKPPLIELMLDGGRILVYGVIMALWGGYREEDRASWPTIRRLKQMVGLFGVASPRQIDLIVARFAQVGHIRVVPVPRDLRMRIVLRSVRTAGHRADEQKCLEKRSLAHRRPVRSLPSCREYRTGPGRRRRNLRGSAAVRGHA